MTAKVKDIEEFKKQVSEQLTRKVKEEKPEPESEPQVTISERGGRYYIIANSFEVEKNAYKFREDAIARGASEAKIILPDNKIRSNTLGND